MSWNHRYGGPERDLDAKLKQALGDDRLVVQSFAANLLFEPWTIRTGQGAPFSVFTPFWRACTSAPEPRHPLPPRRRSSAARCRERRPRRLGPAASGPDWAARLREAWTPGEAARKSGCGRSSTKRSRLADGRDLPTG